jgi:hypothetical protein
MASTLLLAGCASAPKLPNSGTANERFATLGYHDKWTATEFYRLGEGDTVKRLYWAQRRAQETGAGTAEASPVEKLQRRYVNLPSPPYEDADGTLHEGSLHAVEIVQFVQMVPRPNGKRLFLVK